MRLMSAAIAFALLALGACAKAPAAPAVDVQQVTLELHDLESAQLTAINARDIEGAVANYAPDATFYATGAPIAATPEAIRAGMQQFLDDPAMKLTLTPGRADIAASGDLAVTNSDYAITYTDPATHRPATNLGHNVTVWKKGEDGVWRILSDINIDTPPPAPPPAN